MRWTRERCAEAAEEWRKCGSATRAAQNLGKRWGERVSPNGMKCALLMLGISAESLGLTSAKYRTAAGRPSASCDLPSRDLSRPTHAGAADAIMGALGLVLEEQSPVDRIQPKQPVQPSAKQPNTQNGPVGAQGGHDLQRLLSEARRPGATVASVCNELDVSPARLERLVAAARAQGLAVELAGEAIGVRAAPPSDVTVEVAKPVGDEQIIAAISDTHAGSKYAQREQLQDFVRYAYSLGVRHITHSGDWLEGCYDHGRFELSHHGIDDQAQDAIETLPKLDGLSYWGICGNHDQTFTAKIGVEVGPYLEHRFRAAGRSDINIIGNSGGYLRIRGALVHLWHPKGGVPYAISYRLQKQVEAYSPGLKPDVLLCGHLHKFGRIVERGVHAFCVPCFQGPGSAFSNSLVGQPAVGGLILRWKLTEHGTLRAVSDELVSYYHEERPREVA